jgi:hypothetical protein
MSADADTEIRIRITVAQLKTLLARNAYAVAMLKSVLAEQVVDELKRRGGCA